MDEQPIESTPGQGACRFATANVDAAFSLLTTAFQDIRSDHAPVSKAEMLADIVAAQRVLNAAWAVQAARLAQVGAIEDVSTPDPASPDGVRDREVRHAIGAHQAEFIGAEIAPLLGWTTGQAESRVQEATDVITRTPRLFQRVGTGELEPAKLSGVHRALGRTFRGVADDGTIAALDLARELEAALLGDPEIADTAAEAAEVEQGNVDLLARQSTPQVQRRTQRVLTALDPVAAARAARRRRRDRIGVFAHPDDEPGLAHLHAILPSAAAARVMAAVDRHARELQADTTTDKTLAECRADALADLVLGNAKVTTHLVVQVPVHRRDGNAPGGNSGAAFGQAHGSSAAAGFAHPVTGFTVVSGGSPTGQATAHTTSSTGVQMRSQEETDREFNELLKRAYPPDPVDCGDWELDDECDSAGLRPPSDASPCDRPPGWAQPPGPPDPFDPPDRADLEDPPGPCRAGPTAWLGDATVPGVGVIPAEVIEALSRSFGSTMTRALVDADTGITLETCETRYRPSARLQHFVETRDGHCRFPGCVRAARWCDIDHVVPWPEGPTAADNLQCLCRHHHRTKQAHGWSVTMTPEGVCTWTSPSGRSYITTPGE